MHDETYMFDWTTDIAGSGPTWLEVIASHARMLSAIEDGDSYAAGEPRGARPPARTRLARRSAALSASCCVQRLNFAASSEPRVAFPPL